MDSNKIESSLEEVKDIYLEEEYPSRKASRLLRALAKKNNLAAKTFLEEVLDDQRDVWRFLALDTLFSQYDCKGDTKVIEKIQELLLNDQDPAIRSKAASFLGYISQWPDPALRNSLISETDKQVITQVFQAILLLAGIPYRFVEQEVNKLEAGLIEADFENIEEITQKYADFL